MTRCTDLFGEPAAEEPPAWARRLEPELVELDAQLACVGRELALRRKWYASRVAAGELAAPVARRELTAMTAVMRTLKRLHAAEQAGQAGEALAVLLAGRRAADRLGS